MQVEVDRELSRRVAHIVGVGARSAWQKAWLAQQRALELENSLYVEGWAVVMESSLVFEHAWLELNGRIVDPTRWDRKLTYFPGLRFDKSQLLNVMVKQPLLPVSWQYSVSLAGNPAYDRARQAACTFAQERLAKTDSYFIVPEDALGVFQS